MSQPAGLFASAKSLASAWLGIAQTRLELLASELEADRLRTMRLLLFCVFAFFFFFHGMLLVTLLLLTIFWNSHRLLAIGLIAATYLSVAASLACYVHRAFKRAPKPFSVSIAELVKDHAALGPHSSGEGQ